MRFGICEPREDDDAGFFDYCIFERAEITRIETKFDIASESLQRIMNKLPSVEHG